MEGSVSVPDGKFSRSVCVSDRLDTARCDSTALYERCRFRTSGRQAVIALAIQIRVTLRYAEQARDRGAYRPRLPSSCDSMTRQLSLMLYASKAAVPTLSSCLHASPVRNNFALARLSAGEGHDLCRYVRLD